jgi:hypothetical protein
MNSGVHGWPDDDRLHVVRKYDSRGGRAAHAYLTTVDAKGVRTELDFAAHESAVIEPIPVSLKSKTPANVCVLAYEQTTLRLLVHGHGRAELSMFVGTAYGPKRDAPSHRLPGIGAEYLVRLDATMDRVTARGGVVTVPLELDGQVDLEIRPATGGEAAGWSEDAARP